TGIYSKGTINVGVTGTATINFIGTNGIGIFNDGGILNIGSLITLGGTGLGSFAVTTNGNLTNSGTITVSNGSKGLLGKYTIPGTYLISNTSTGIINITDGGIGIAAIGTASTVTVQNDGTINVQDEDSVGIYAETGSVVNNGVLNVDDDGIGIYVTGIAGIGTYGTLDVSGGVGVVVDGVGMSGTGTITLNDGTNNHYSIGAYVIGASGVLVLPTISQIGSYTIGVAIENGTGVSLGNVLLPGATATNQIGYILKDSTVTTGTVDVFGNNNLGVHGKNTTLNTGAITIGNSANAASTSVGLYMENGTITTGQVTTGINSIGIYGEKSNITTGEIISSDNAVGIYGKGQGTYTESINVVGNMTVGDNNAIGVYGKRINISVIAPTSITVGKETSIAVVSEGEGNVSVTGDMTIADKLTKGSIGIYKKGEANNITTSGNWTIGKSGYGIYLIGEGSGIVATNNSSLDLGESAVGIFADGENGNVTITNTGTIDVGSTYLGVSNDHWKLDEHENSAGIYLKNGAKCYNVGTIIADEDHSVGVYATDTGTEIINNGIITVSNGSTGILAKQSAVVINNGTITVLDEGSSWGGKSIGIAGYAGTLITNSTTGIINAGDGIGIYIGTGSRVNNQGIINVTNGTGILGVGVVMNAGIINVIGTGTAVTKTGTESLSEGAVTIDETGIKINGNYIAVGGTFNADQAILLDGAYVDVTTIPGREIPLFTAPDVSGKVRLSSDFVKLGDGYSFKIENFTLALASSLSGNIEVITSPMYIPKVLGDGSLMIAKKPYKDLVIGEQFADLYNGLDSLLYNDKLGLSDDSQLLKRLNGYLEDIFAVSGEGGFNREVSRALAETRGDVYSTIQQRINSIQSAFDESFEELLGSYNISKDSSKYSVLYTQGQYKDDTIGIDDYDYRVQGLLYMKEYEGKNFGNKYGFSLGFAVSNFEFDDAPTYGGGSKENVYSLRAGVHNVYNFNDEDTLRLISKLELGYNKHETERKMELDKSYTNKGKYDSYQVSFDNRIEKTIYRSLSGKIDLYAGLNLEYGKISKFDEEITGDSGAALEVKGKDYFSVMPEIGIKGEKRAYIGKKLSAKIEGKISYGYELGNTKHQTKAKIKNGTAGYYELIRPEEEKGNINAKIGFTVERANKAGVTFEIGTRKYDNKSKVDMNYGVRFKYVL
ncbi:MAG: autotransporter-associated N-terminal domain-containing protein, partial [Fusobacteriaceae bacterium]|nr:autotransporter-associated N-terminal domain-containing protein [Fusobacteriaceae bacterium]